MARQTEIPGTEQPSNPEVNAAAEAYVKARDERMEKTRVEVAAKERLLDSMRKHKLHVYKDTNAVPPLLVTRKAGDETVKVEEVEGTAAIDESAGGGDLADDLHAGAARKAAKDAKKAKPEEGLQ